MRRETLYRKFRQLRQQFENSSRRLPSFAKEGLGVVGVDP